MHGSFLHLGLHCCDSIHNPFADLWVAVLPYRKVVFPGRDEGAWWIYGAFVEDSVDGYSEEVGEGCEEGLVGVEDVGRWW